MLQAHNAQKCPRKQMVHREQGCQIIDVLLHWPTANTTTTFVKDMQKLYNSLQYTFRHKHKITSNMLVSTHIYVLLLVLAIFITHLHVKPSRARYCMSNPDYIWNGLRINLVCKLIYVWWICAKRFLHFCSRDLDLWLWSQICSPLYSFCIHQMYSLYRILILSNRRRETEKQTDIQTDATRQKAS